AGFLDDTDIKEEVLFDDPFYFYAAQDNKILKQKEVSVIDLDVNSLLLLADGHCLRTQILDLCHAHNPLGKNLHLEGGSLETIIRMVDKTGGATILPKMAVDFLSAEKKELCVREFKERGSAKRQISIATGRNFIKKAALNKLKEIILKNI
ncbi:MAG: LysR substrate-binding domain-containing protein, partial [Rikenellaceae bacterium]